MNLDRKTLLICAVCLCVGWYTAGGSKPAVPTPLDDRPVLRWIARAAKTLLWVSLVAEEPPQPEPSLSDVAIQDGQPIVNHGRGW